MRTSNWVHLPQFSGWKFQKYLAETTTYRKVFQQPYHYPTVFHRKNHSSFPSRWVVFKPTNLTWRIIPVRMGFPPISKPGSEKAIWKGSHNPDPVRGRIQQSPWLWKPRTVSVDPSMGSPILQPSNPKPSDAYGVVLLSFRLAWVKHWGPATWCPIHQGYQFGWWWFEPNPLRKMGGSKFPPFQHPSKKLGQFI